MQPADLNPYSSPAHVTHVAETAAPVTRWRIIPAAVSLVLGIASFGIGVSAVGVMTYVLLIQDVYNKGGMMLTNEAGMMLAGCALYLGFGAAWIAAGRLYWRGKYAKALLANCVGVMFPVVLFAIHGV